MLLPLVLGAVPLSPIISGPCVKTYMQINLTLWGAHHIQHKILWDYECPEDCLKLCFPCRQASSRYYMEVMGV